MTALNENAVSSVSNAAGTAQSAYKNLAEALIAFQATVPTITENDSSYHGKFANLPGILSTIGPALRACGLAVCQLPADTADGPGLRTTLMHTSGESITAVSPLSIQTGTDSKGRPLNVTQEWGKAMTYTRRYALQAALGICVGIEDNDADSELTVPPVGKTSAPAKAAPVKLDAAQQQQAIDIIKGPGGQEAKAKFMAKYFPDADALFPEMIELQEHLDFLTANRGSAI